MPTVRLYTESLFVGEGGDEITASVLSLTTDARSDSFTRHALESLGAVEIDTLDDCAVLPGSCAEYVLHLDGDVHSLCAFTAYGVPALKKRGIEVEIDSDYPWQAVGDDAPWYAEVSSEGDDWFGLELGVEANGQRINMLPALLDLLDQTSNLSSLKRTARRCFAVPAGPQRFVAVPPERLELILGVLLEIYGIQGSSGAPLPMSQAAGLARIGLAFGDDVDQLRWCGDTRIRDRGYAQAIGSGKHRVVELDTPAEELELKATLRCYQEEGVSWLGNHGAAGAGAILADDMGLGKTLQTIAHITREKQCGRIQAPVLIVAPTSLIENWRREFAKFSPQIEVLVLTGPRRKKRFPDIVRSDVVITSYALLVRDLAELGKHVFDLMVVDEAHYIKNRHSLTNRAARSIESHRRLCLTGTPIENHLGELWSLFDFASPGFLGTHEQFRSAFRIPIEDAGDETRIRSLRDRIGPYVLRRTKERVASELPPKTEMVRAVDLSGPQRDLYESIRIAAHAQVRQAIRSRGLAGSTVTVLDALLKLRQVCCDPRLARVDAARQVESSAKLELLMELAERLKAENRRVLVFSQFTTMLKIILERMTDAGLRCSILTGASSNRQALCDQFQRGEVDAFLISLKAGGCGLNLTAADTVIHYDPWWNPAAQAQASDRAHRIGQKKPVFVYNLIVAGSVEERMLSLQSHKRRLADALLGGERTRLSEREVESLLAPLGSGSHFS